MEVYIVRAFADGLDPNYIKFIVSKLFYNFCFLPQNDYAITLNTAYFNCKYSHHV